MRIHLIGKKLLFLLFLFLGFLFLGVGYMAFAQSKTDIVFPVSELGDCQNEEECRAYCDDSSHIQECVAFAEKHGLISSQEAARAKAFIEAGKGPGGCASQQECKSYCDSAAHIEECLSFAETHQLMSSEELQEAKRVAQALRQGAQLPGGCTSKEACEVYCQDASHMEECIDFAEQAGFISQRELAEARQVLKALEAGVQTPGNCARKEQCEAYCQDVSHAEECFNFAVAAGFIPPEEAEQARKMMSLMAQGGMPGNCKSREQCETYCVNESHIQECAEKFAQAGVITHEEKQMFIKTGGKGPGGCRGRDTCDAFCNNPENQEACFAFAKEHGLISEEELANIEEGMQRMRQGIESAPPEVAACLQEKVGIEALEKMRSGQFTPNHQIGDVMRECFEKQQEVMQNQMRSCLEKPCQEALACLQSFSGGGGGEFPAQEGGNSMEQEIQAKISICTEEIIRQQQGQNGPPPGFEGSHPSSEEQYRHEIQVQTEQYIQQETQRQREQQMQEQVHEQPPTPTQEPLLSPEPPQGGSVLDAALYFISRLLGI